MGICGTYSKDRFGYKKGQPSNTRSIFYSAKSYIFGIFDDIYRRFDNSSQYISSYSSRCILHFLDNTYKMDRRKMAIRKIWIRLCEIL